MSKVVKVLLILVGGAVVVCLAAALGAWLWLDANKGRLLAMGRQVTEEGRQWGAGRGNQDCVAEAQRRVDGCDGVMCEARNAAFLRACLAASVPAPGFCEGVPADRDILRTVAWRGEYCGARGRATDQRCQRLLAAVQQHCHAR